MLEFDSELLERINSIISDCDSEIQFYEEKQQHLPYIKKSKKELALWSEYFIVKIKFNRLLKLTFEVITKQNRILLSILKERYANILVDVMEAYTNCVQNNVIPENMYLDFCDGVAKSLTNDMYELIDDIIADKD